LSGFIARDSCARLGDIHHRDDQPPAVALGRRAKLCPAIVFNQAMLSLAEISDRLEIRQLMVDYSTAIDSRRFDDLDKVFTPDAYID
jgi:SnoaL-like domain